MSWPVEKDAHIWFSEKISAMCSFSQSISLRAEKANSSISDSAMRMAEFRSSATHAAEPTARGGPRRIAILTVCGLDAMKNKQ